MAPSPNRDHQEFEFELTRWLVDNWAKPNGCQVYHQRNVAEPGMWPDNYRVPDIVLVTPSRFQVDRNEYFEGGPDAVVEIHSPGDEAYEKLDFYAKVGVREIWIIERDTKRPEVFERIRDTEYQKREAGADGWVRSNVAGAEMRATAEGKLEIRVAGRNDTLGKLP